MFNPSACASQLVACMSHEDYVSGEICGSELYVRQLIVSYGADTIIPWLKDVFIQNFANIHVTIGILHMLSHLAYTTVGVHGVAMALRALREHTDPEVLEFTIKALENWGSPEYLEEMRACKERLPKDLQDYIRIVLKDLENA